MMSAFRRFIRMLLPPILIALGVPLHAAPAYAAPGDLDPTFGSGGKVTTPGVDEALAVAIQADGKLVVAGYSITGDSSNDFVLARYSSTGTLDPSFGSGGKVTTPIGTGNDAARAVAIQTDGKIVAAGQSDTGSGNSDFALARYTTAGALDPSFDSDGKITTPIGPGDDFGHAVAIQADGKIVVAGYGSNGSNDDFALARYTSTGALDSTFGTGGRVTTPIGSFDRARAVAIQADGKIVAAGESDNHFALTRYISTGALDLSFGNGGKVITPIASTGDYAYAVALQGDGRIVAAGYATGGSDDFALARYTSAGALDPTFDGDGKVITPIGSGHDYAYGVALQADGKIVAAGASKTESTDDFALARYTSAGALDPTFDGDGKVITPINAFDDFARGVAVQADGKIVAAGRSQEGFALVRYLADPPTISIFDASVTEGDSSTTNLSFTVSLAGAGANDVVSTQYATGNGSATAPADYTAKSGTLTFNPGQTSKILTVVVKGDLIDEPDESLFVRLSSPTAATIENGTATGTIVDNDGVPDLSITGGSVVEGNSGTTGLAYTLSLTNPSSEYIFVDYATANGTAQAGSDYQARSGTKVIKPGRTTAQITIQVIGETAPEPNETVFVDLVDADGASLDDPHGIGTIVDDDRPTISINDVRVTEGAAGTTKTMTFVVTLSKASTQSITVAYATADAEAVAPGDYTAKSGTLTFSAGQVSKNIAITIKGDNVTECNESFFVDLSNPTNATIADGQGVGTILTDEPSPCD